MVSSWLVVASPITVALKSFRCQAGENLQRRRCFLGWLVISIPSRKAVGSRFERANISGWDVYHSFKFKGIRVMNIFLLSW